MCVARHEGIGSLTAKLVKLAIQKRGLHRATLNLAAGRLDRTARLEQHDFMQSQIVLIEDGGANRAEHLAEIHAAQLLALYLANND